MCTGEPIVLTDATEIAEALERNELLPHPSADQRHGATLRLRRSMARFSGPDDHAARRQAVVDAIRAIDPERARAFATEQAAARLDGAPIDGIEIAGAVPTEAIARCLALDAPLDQVVVDTLAIVRVIGRGAPSTPESDAAAGRMLALCADHPGGGVATVSVLYQNFDATWSLLTTLLLARASQVRAVPAVPRTRRVATADAVLTTRTIPAGADVLLEIGQAGLPWGSGPHQCPGQRLAEAIVAGILAAIDAAHYEVGIEGVVTDPDGRPTQLPMSVR